MDIWCYDSINRVLAAIETQHTPNVNAVVRSLTGKSVSDPINQHYVLYVNAVSARIGLFQAPATN